MTSQPVYFHQASAGRRNLARAYGMLVVVAEIAASLLPIADAGFASPGQALAPYVVAVAILLLFCAFNCLAAYRTGTLPGLKSFGVKAVLVVPFLGLLLDGTVRVDVDDPRQPVEPGPTQLVGGVLEDEEQAADQGEQADEALHGVLLDGGPLGRAAVLDEDGLDPQGLQHRQG
ncbi:MAG: hypothetical protein ACFNKK_05575, partial [Peptidiphaga sp.]